MLVFDTIFVAFGPRGWGRDALTSPRSAKHRIGSYLINVTTLFCFLSRLLVAQINTLRKQNHTRHSESCHLKLRTLNVEIDWNLASSLRWIRFAIRNIFHSCLTKQDAISTKIPYSVVWNKMILILNRWEKLGKKRTQPGSSYHQSICLRNWRNPWEISGKPMLSPSLYSSSSSSSSRSDNGNKWP